MLDCEAARGGFGGQRRGNRRGSEACWGQGGSERFKAARRLELGRLGAKSHAAATTALASNRAAASKTPKHHQVFDGGWSKNPHVYARVAANERRLDSARHHTSHPAKTNVAIDATHTHTHAHTHTHVTHTHTHTHAHTRTHAHTHTHTRTQAHTHTHTHTTAAARSHNRTTSNVL